MIRMAGTTTLCIRCIIFIAVAIPLGFCFSCKSVFGLYQLKHASIITCSLSSYHNDDVSHEAPSYVESIVLRQVYPAMMKHLSEYGNPNIPLGTIDGKRCKTLRRMAFEGKLSDSELKLLEEINFRFNSFEDIYEEADFDDCLQRLIMYEEENKTNFQIPKKFKPDPELGAWVTIIRRIGRDNINEDRRKKLDNIGFAWASTRKCGSAFMSSYRPLKERLLRCCDRDDATRTGYVVNESKLKQILAENEVKRWIRAQAEAASKGNLSQARCDYMDQLPGFDWRQL